MIRVPRYSSYISHFGLSRWHTHTHGDKVAGDTFHAGKMPKGALPPHLHPFPRTKRCESQGPLFRLLFEPMLVELRACRSCLSREPAFSCGIAGPSPPCSWQPGEDVLERIPIQLRGKDATVFEKNMFTGAFSRGGSS